MWILAGAGHRRGSAQNRFYYSIWTLSIRVMPFGLCGAPATFQHMMNPLIEGLENFKAAYSDDFVIYSES